MANNNRYVECRQVLVANSDIGHVTTCPECGHVHVNLRSLTVRFEMEAFRELVDMLGFAQKRLDADPALRDAETKTVSVSGIDSAVVRH
ncbi:hypothetical protein [Undibacterium sp. RuTC16W]|uniref:hypothetical protein n=1 Tax=Undibacterium sp. RuTC16W TaxID=3413048 RepID=UPI003BF37923